MAERSSRTAALTGRASLAAWRPPAPRTYDIRPSYCEATVEHSGTFSTRQCGFSSELSRHSLAPTPWQSGTINHEQVVSKADNPRLRAIAVEMAWLWLRHRPGSALARWYRERVRRFCPRTRKVTIVALARKLPVALWKYVTGGVVIEGAGLKAA